MLHALELNHGRIFPSAFRLDAFHRLNPSGAVLPPPDWDAITETKVPGIARDALKVGERKTENRRRRRRDGDGDGGRQAGPVA